MSGTEPTETPPSAPAPTTAPEPPGVTVPVEPGQPTPEQPAPNPPVTPTTHEPAPTEPPVPAPEPLKPHTETPTLLEGLGDKPAADAKPAEPVATPTPPPTAPVYDLKFPDNLAPEPTQLEAFTAIAGKHNLDQDTAQSLVDMHLGAFKTFADNLLSEQHRVFADTRREWVEQIRSDPQLGGAGHETAMRAVARMRDMLVPEQHRAEFDQFLRVTGAGDHPAFMRILHNAARYFDEPAPPAVQAMPTADRGVTPRTFREAMYTHPTSQKVSAR